MGAAPDLSPASKPAGIRTAARIFLSAIRCFQSSVAATTLTAFDSCNRATTPGESAPSRITTIGVSSRALLITLEAIVPNPNVISGITSVGMTMIEISVRRSRSESFSSFR